LSAAEALREAQTAAIELRVEGDDLALQVPAEPFVPVIRRPSTPLSTIDETAIRAWLAKIGETDPETIAQVIYRSKRDADARDFFPSRAVGEIPEPDPLPDDRRFCTQCANLVDERCQAARLGEIAASRNYTPLCDIPRRCAGYLPGAFDTDRRSGRERWPGLAKNWED
jgi:hypothetical protein